MDNDNKYQRGKIYRIVCNTTGLQYYGSTIEKTLSARLSKHKYHYKHHLNGKMNYLTSFNIIKNENYEIFLVELFPCNSKDELHQRERYYIENNECVNKNIPSRTPKESYQKHYETNKENIKEYNKEYYETNKEKIKKYYEEYYEAKKDEILRKQKKYNEMNKQKIKEYQKEYQKEYCKQIKMLI